MNRHEIISRVENLTGDGPLDPKTLRWLREGFRQHIRTGDPLTRALGIARHCPQGLAAAMRNERFAQALGRAVTALDPAPGTSAHSLAKLIGKELERLARRQRPRPAVSTFEQHLSDALRVHPLCPVSPSGLWPIIHDALLAIGERPIHSVAIAADNTRHDKT